MSSLGPTQEKDRIQSLDVIRGIAILGILPVNLIQFALPLSGPEKVHFVSPDASEGVAFFVLAALFQYKFITIFSFLFGAGIALQAERARAKGRSLGGRYVWRNFLLGAIGLFHALVLWYGDILFHYAIYGVACFLFVRLRNRWLTPLAIALILLPICMALGIGALIGSMEGPAASHSPWAAAFGPEAPDTLGAALAEPAATEAKLWSLHPGRETLVYREGSYLDAFVQRLTAWAFLALAVLLYFGWRIAGLFLLGMAFLKAGVFSRPTEHRRLLHALIAAGLLAGLPIECFCAAQMVGGGLGPAGMIAIDGVHQVGSLLLALCLVAAILRFQTALLRPFAAVGRTALSNYLLQTVVCVTLFYSFGFGLFGRLDRVELWGVFLAIVVAQVPLSVLWLRWFQFGPIEWAWRSLTYQSWQPFVRAPSA